MTRPLRAARRAVAALLHVVAVALWFCWYLVSQLARRVEPRPEPAAELEQAPSATEPEPAHPEPAEAHDVEPPAGRQLTEHERRLWMLAIHQAQHRDVPRA